MIVVSQINAWISRLRECLTYRFQLEKILNYFVGCDPVFGRALTKVTLARCMPGVHDLTAKASLAAQSIFYDVRFFDKDGNPFPVISIEPLTDEVRKAVTSGNQPFTGRIVRTRLSNSEDSATSQVFALPKKFWKCRTELEAKASDFKDMLPARAEVRDKDGNLLKANVDVVDLILGEARSIMKSKGVRDNEVFVDGGDKSSIFEVIQNLANQHAALVPSAITSF